MSAITYVVDFSTLACAVFILKAVWHQRELSEMLTQANASNSNGRCLAQLASAADRRATLREGASSAIMWACGLSIIGMIACYY